MAPCSSGRDGEPHWTVVGAVGTGGRAAVDPRGLVTPVPGGWSLDWWIGADDRWHLPSRETAVTQSLAGGSGVVETVVRIPSGRAVQRVYGLATSPDLAVVEVENDSPVPAAVAFAVRPFDPLGATGVGSVSLEGTLVRVDGRGALALPRPPLRVAASTLAGGDCAAVVVEGRAEEGSTLALDDPDRMATAAFVFPLAHRASLRVALALDRGLARPLDITALPGPAAVEAAWAGHLDRGMRVVLPDERSQRAVEGARAHLLLLDDGTAVTPVPWGRAQTSRDDAAVVLAALERWGFGRQAAEVAGSVRRRLVPWRKLRRPASLPGDEAWARAATLLDAASPTHAWAAGGAGHHGRPLADFLLAVRDGLVAEHEDGSVGLLPALPPGWHGRPLEVRGAPVAGGVVSYALRWHGSRAALLWEIEGDAPVVRCSALDPAWSSAERRGEALLGPAGGEGSD